MMEEDLRVGQVEEGEDQSCLAESRMEPEETYEVLVPHGVS